MDLKTLHEDFSKSWKELKSFLDQQAEEVQLQNDLLSDLIETQKEHDQILKELINRHF